LTGDVPKIPPERPKNFRKDVRLPEKQREWNKRESGIVENSIDDEQETEGRKSIVEIRWVQRACSLREA